MKRRLVLGLAFSSLIARTVHASHPDQDESQIMQLFREYRRLMVLAESHVCLETDEEAELDRLFYDACDEIEDRIMSLPCTCTADFAAKVIVDTVHGGVFSDWKTGRIWIEARALTGDPDFMVAP